MSADVERIECPVCHSRELVIAGGTRLRKHRRYAVGDHGVPLYRAPRVPCEGATHDVTALVAVERERLRMERLRDAVMAAELHVAFVVDQERFTVACAEARIAKARERLDAANAALAAAVAAEPRAPIVSPATAARCADDAEPCAGCDHPMGNDGVRSHRFGCQVSRPRMTLAADIDHSGRVTVR